MRRSFGIVVALAVCSLLGVTASARASIVVNITENTSTNQTMVQATGSLDTALFGTPLTGNFGGGTYLGANQGNIGLMPAPSPADHYTMAQPFMVPFGSGTSTSGTFLGPDIFMINSNGSFADQLRLPANYVSGTPISAAGLLIGTFTSLGITPDTVVMNLPGEQTITVQFSTVPEPAAGLLALAGAATLALRRRRSA